MGVAVRTDLFPRCGFVLRIRPTRWRFLIFSVLLMVLSLRPLGLDRFLVVSGGFLVGMTISARIYCVRGKWVVETSEMDIERDACEVESEYQEDACDDSKASRYKGEEHDLHEQEARRHDEESVEE